jgi:hypothetical protein
VIKTKSIKIARAYINILLIIIVNNIVSAYTEVVTMFYGMIIPPIIIMGVTGIVLATSYVTDHKEFRPATREKSQKIAEDFLLECPTYKCDGLRDSIKLSVINVLPQMHCWKFIFTFDCRQPGYGNRYGQKLLQITTQHRLTITVENGQITCSTIDGTWDELLQQPI